MRTRRKEPTRGYLELVAELQLVAKASGSLAEALLKPDLDLFLKALRAVPGFNGTGFRAKEMLADLAETSHVWSTPSRKPAISAQYQVISVIGVGPCRVVNWLLNQPFRNNEAMPTDFKEKLYLPVLQYIASYLRWKFPSYRGRPNLCIFYEMCEFNKQLVAAYAGGGKAYSPSSHEVPEPDLKRLKLDVDQLRLLRESEYAVRTAVRAGPKQSFEFEETDYL
jgi:hypothetical protein